LEREGREKGGRREGEGREKGGRREGEGREKGLGPYSMSFVFAIRCHLERELGHSLSLPHRTTSFNVIFGGVSTP